MTALHSRYGPLGYLVFALDCPDPLPGKPLKPWDLEHLTKYHGWPQSMIEDAGASEIGHAHDEQHVAHEKDEGELSIPHKHWEIVPVAIEASDYPRELREVLLGVIELVAISGLMPNVERP